MTFLVAAVVNFSLDLAFQVSNFQAKIREIPPGKLSLLLLNVLRG